MITTNHTHIAHLAELCVFHDIHHIVISPGSRNAPLIIAFDEHPDIKTYLIHDERSAAFFALGLADALQKPVAVVCTSGSAPLNYAPAIAEAYYRNVPLLILTADRPIALVDQGDGQTIRQKNVFANYIKASFELPDFSLTEASLKKSNEIIHNAFNELCSVAQGPVHINIPLSEPLYVTEELQSMPERKPLVAVSAVLSDTQKNYIEHSWKKFKKKLIIVGQKNAEKSFLKKLEPLLNQPDVAVLVENTSNLYHFGKIVHCIDRTLAFIGEEEFDKFQPDLLISTGGAVISKKIKAFFRSNKPAENWRVGNYLFEEDTYQSLTKSFAVDATDFLDFVGNIDYPAESNFGNHWKQKDFLAQEKHLDFLSQTKWCDLKVFEILLDAIPENSVIHMGNSSVVRYCQLFNPIESCRYFSNRGVSGIDGSTSTAAGYASVNSNQLNVMISGDISFIYDSNALWNNHLTSNFRIVVMNNGGGGIFKILEGSNSVKQKDYFFSPYNADIEKLTRAFDIEYLSASNENELNAVMPAFFSRQFDKPVVLEIKTFSQNNADVLKDYFNFLRSHRNS